MSTTVEQLAEQAMSLSVESRARLADLLVESLGSAELDQIEQTWLAEAKRRRDEVRHLKVGTITGPEALRKVRDTRANDLEIIISAPTISTKKLKMCWSIRLPCEAWRSLSRR